MLLSIMERMDGLLTRSDVPVTLTDLVDRALRTFQRRENPHEPNRHRQGDADHGVDKTTGRQDPRLGEFQRTVLVATWPCFRRP